MVDIFLFSYFLGFFIKGLGLWDKFFLIEYKLKGYVCFLWSVDVFFWFFLEGWVDSGRVFGFVDICVG